MNEINLNDIVYVRLTDYGKDIYYHRYDELNNHIGHELIKPHFPEEDKCGYSKFQLWDFINIYGPYINMTSKKVIEPLNIYFKGEDNEKILLR